MNVTFFCAQCGAKLQVEDQWCGKPITCPNCQQIVIVPPPEMAIPVATEATPAAATDPGENPPVNPYESPILFQGNMLAEISGDMLPVRVKSLELFKNTWKFVFRYFREFCLIGLVFLLLNGFVLGTMYLAGFSDMATPHFNADGEAVPVLKAQQVPGALLCVWLVAGLVGFVLTVMVYQYILHLLRTGERSLINMIPRSFQTFHRSFFSCFLYMLIVMGLYIVMAVGIGIVVGGGAVFLQSLQGTLDSFWYPIVNIGAFCLLGILAIAVFWGLLKVFIGYSFFMPFVIDRDMGCLESLSNSNKYAKDNIFRYVVAVFLTFLPFSFLIALAISVIAWSPDSSASIAIPLVLQLIQNAFAYPLTLVLGANMYFQMTNQQHIFSKQM